MINSKSKGSKGERELCKWWKNWTGQEFSRVPSSGGLRWSRTTDSTGDIINSDKKHFLRFPFSIECKNYKTLDIKDILRENKKPQVLEFWDQAQSDAKRGHKLPILFMRENNMAKGLYYVIINKNVAEILKDGSFKHPYFHIKYNDYNFYLLTSVVLSEKSYKELYPLFRKLLRNEEKNI